MTQKWNLQDIRPAEPRKKRPVRPPDEVEAEINDTKPILTEREKIPNIVIEDGSKRGPRRLIISIILFVVIVGAATGLGAMLGKTEITIYPKFRERNINAEFIAYPDKRADALSYDIMELDANGESQVKATGQTIVEEQAIGMIEIIKTTPGQERLIKNTRFRTPEGLVYRIQESVVVPGALEDETGATVPGIARAEVFADQPGEEYNIPAGTTFDIPGFEESNLTALYKAITARTPEAITGGFSGPQFEIDENELNTARQALQIELRDDLLSQVENEKPAGFIAFKGAIAITYNQMPAVESGQDLVTIRENAVLQIPVFEIEELGSYLAKETVAGYEGGPVRVDDPSVIEFKYTSPTTSSSVIANATSLSFSLTGKPLLIWEYDGEKLKENLAGLPKTALENAILAHPGIRWAGASITPFWKQTFPEDTNDIILIEELKEPE